ncbi:hypothetical protein COT47_08370, partial [Candidatus Woesearchaeota archaeon CG08_land_8_20_14_0_20_43_7]
MAYLDRFLDSLKDGHNDKNDFLDDLLQGLSLTLDIRNQFFFEMFKGTGYKSKIDASFLTEDDLSKWYGELEKT